MRWTSSQVALSLTQIYQTKPFIRKQGFSTPKTSENVLETPAVTPTICLVRRSLGRATLPIPSDPTDK